MRNKICWNIENYVASLEESYHTKIEVKSSVLATIILIFVICYDLCDVTGRLSSVSYQFRLKTFIIITKGFVLVLGAN